MKNKKLSLLVGLLATLSLTSCGGKVGDSKTESFDFSGTGYLQNDFFAIKETNASLLVGSSHQIKIESYPESYVDKSVNFKSKDESIAKVNSEGLVTGVSEGITDIIVSSDDGKISSMVHIMVGTKATGSRKSSVINNINAMYADPSHKVASKFFLREYDEETYSCEGKEDHGYYSFETMAFDYNEGYFMVQSQDLYLLTEDGSKIPSSGKWIFYTIGHAQKTRMIHITENVRSYMEINTSHYSYEDGEAICAVLDMFFASGRKIVKDMLDNVENSSFKSYANSGRNVYVAGDDKIYYEISENDSDVVDADDEINYFDIYAGTEYTYDYIQSTIQNGDKCEALSVALNMHYLQDGKNWTRSFSRSMTFAQEFEMEKYECDATDSGFTLADTIYDL